MKKSRHERILEMIGQEDIGTQDRLVELLQAEGYKITQATVSRDVRELNLTKVSTPDGNLKYVSSKVMGHYMKEKYVNVLRTGYMSMERAGNLMVMKTVPGMAMAAAAALDALKLEHVVGCIAGDDTIFVAVRESEDVAAVIREIREMIG